MDTAKRGKQNRISLLLHLPYKRYKENVIFFSENYLEPNTYQISSYLSINITDPHLDLI